ncbi:MAG TPA: hypothetical protein VLD62_10525 [Acidimicrobiia bacterium]|nr:hypothetical protein [Acidimicrobiia bacterium]
MARRLTVVGLVAVMVLGAVPALADQPVEDLILDGSEIDFRGRGVVLTTWGTDTAAAVFTVSRANGMSMVSTAGGTLAVGDGVVARRQGDAWYGMNVVASVPWAVADQYDLRDDGLAVRLDRTARLITILEDGFPRMRITLDAETSIPLRTEVLDASGRVFRASFLTELSAMSGVAGVQQRTTGPFMEDAKQMERSTATDRLPEQVDGYRRVDVYAAPGGGVHAFYTDGLFAFSVFEYRRTATPRAFERAGEVLLSGHRYRRIVEPSQIWLHWHAPDQSYVLVGDLPPDHLDEVMASLPAPGDRGFFVRLWRRLFG